MIHLQQVSKLYRTDRVETTALDNSRSWIPASLLLTSAHTRKIGNSTHTAALAVARPTLSGPPRLVTTRRPSRALPGVRPVDAQPHAR